MPPDARVQVVDGAGARSIVGVIGGMGPLATLAFYGAIVRETRAERDQDHVHVMIESDPSIPDRTDFLFAHGDDPRPALIAVARRLEAAGAAFLVMPCNTAHVFADTIEAAVQVPLVRWPEAAAAALPRHRPVGLLATSGTLKAALYQPLLEVRGIEAILPDDVEQKAIMQAIHAMKGAGEIAHDVRQRVLEVAEGLVQRGATSVLLACTELPLAINANDAAWPVQALDPATVVARRVIELAGHSVRDVSA